MLQLVHELYPMIVMWDDHEYADDAWGDVATYFSGRVNEKNTARKRNAERAYFEYLPIEYGLDATGQLAITDSMLYPNVKIYRDFRWGANLHLVLTDARSFRPDHTVPRTRSPARWCSTRRRSRPLSAPRCTRRSRTGSTRTSTSTPTRCCRARWRRSSPSSTSSTTRT